MNTTIINGIKTVGIATAVGAAGFAGYEIRGNQNEIMGNPVENIETAYDRIVSSCAKVVLDEADVKFEIIPNDPTTKSDEAFDSALIATEDGQKYVDEQFELCMDSEYYVPVGELEAEAPAFTLKQLEGEEQ